MNSLRQRKLYNFILDKPPGYDVFCEPETNHCNKINKSVLKTITFHREDDNQEEVDLNQETLTFTLKLIEI